MATDVIALATGNKYKPYFYVYCSLFPWKSQFFEERK
nr:MAG TPA: hypothetical protein [Caudoviricetes sp.]